MQYLTERTEMQVVGGVLSPSHDMYLRGVCRRFPAQAVPIKHRTAMTELAVEGSSWLSVRRWEATRRNVMDYRSVLKNVQQVG
jgi:nicotinic acid mononucleotide adenylyltransferase